MYVNEIFKEAREKKGLSQTELGNILGIGQDKLSKWENIDKKTGKYHTIPMDYYKDFCDALEIDYFHFIDDLMDCIFIRENLSKDFNDFFNKDKEIEIKEIAEEILEKNKKLENLIKKSKTFLEKQINDLSEFIIVHNLSIFETKEELKTKLKKDVFDIFKEKDSKNIDMQNYYSNFLLKISPSLFIISEKEQNKEIFSFLKKIFTTNNHFRKFNYLFFYEISENTNNLENYFALENSEETTEENHFYNRTIKELLNMIIFSEKNYKIFEKLTDEKIIIIDMILFYFLEEIPVERNFWYYKSSIKKGMIEDHWTFERNKIKTLIVTPNIFQKCEEKYRSKIELLSRRKNILKELSFLNICKEYKITEKDFENFIKATNCYYFKY